MVSLRSAVLWTMLSLCAFAAAEAAIFRSGWYLDFLEPVSSTGQLELRLYWLGNASSTRRQEVLVLGDSRMAEGFSARQAQAAVGNRLRFWNAGVGGTSPRVWYYFIRDADPTRTRFAAIVLPLDRYYDDLNKRAVDLNYAAGRLRITDCIAFARSVDLPGQKFGMFSGCMFKGIVFRRDVAAFLSDIPKRIRVSEDWRENGIGYVNGYEGKAEDVSGIAVDRANRRIDFPARLNEMQRFTITETVLPSAEREPADLTAYRKLWLGRILDLYARSPTRIVFVEMPQRPVAMEESGAPTRFEEWVRSRGDVRTIPPETFRDLERPELFADGLHLNHLGRPLFSERLGVRVEDSLLDGR